MAELDKTISVIESWLKQPVLTPPPKNELYDALELLKEQENNIDTLKTLILGYESGALLKDQEPKLVQSIREIAMRTYGYCPNCGLGLDSYHDGNSGEHITHFCYNCGQAVKWE